MFTLDTASLLEYVSIKLKGHYIMRQQIDLRYKKYNSMFRYIYDAYKIDIRRYCFNYSIDDHIKACDLYFLGWLYQNHRFTAADIQDAFYANIDNIPIIKMLYKLYPDLRTNEAMIHALLSQNLYVIKWVYTNINTLIDYTNVKRCYRGNMMDVLNCFSYPTICNTINIFSAMEANDLIYIMWHCEVSSNINAYKLLIIAVNYNSVKILHWLHDTYKVCDVQIMLTAMECKSIACVLWLSKNCATCSSNVPDTSDYSSDVAYYNRERKKLIDII